MVISRERKPVFYQRKPFFPHDPYQLCTCPGTERPPPGRRHRELVAEMKLRGYKPQFDGIRREQFPDIPTTFWQDWAPDAEALHINRMRLAERGGAPYSERIISSTANPKVPA